MCVMVFCLKPHTVGRMVDTKVNSTYTWEAYLVWELDWGLSVAELILDWFFVIPFGAFRLPDC